MENKVKKPKSSDSKKKRNILLGVLIPVGVIGITLGTVLPIVMCKGKNNGSDQGIQVDKDNWVEAMRYCYDETVSSNYTCTGNNDSKNFDMKVDVDKQYMYGDGGEYSNIRIKNWYKKVDSKYKVYTENEPTWQDVVYANTPKGTFEETFKVIQNLYDDFTFKDGYYYYEAPTKEGTDQAKIKLIKVDGKTRVSSLKMTNLSSGKVKGEYNFSNFGKTTIDDMPA